VEDAMKILDLEAAIREDVVTEVRADLAGAIRVHRIVNIEEPSSRFTAELNVRCACGETFGAYHQVSPYGPGIYLGGYSDHLASLVR
jgi:hypothetical protein